MDYQLAGTAACLQAALNSATTSFHLDLAYAITHTAMRWILPPELEEQAAVPLQQQLESQRCVCKLQGQTAWCLLACSANLWTLLVASITWSVASRAGLAALIAAEGVLWDELLVLEARCRRGCVSKGLTQGWCSCSSRRRRVADSSWHPC